MRVARLDSRPKPATDARLSVMSKQAEGVADVSGRKSMPPPRTHHARGVLSGSESLSSPSSRGPFAHCLALLLGRHWLNFVSTRAWDAFVYFVIAPIVGTVIKRRRGFREEAMNDVGTTWMLPFAPSVMATTAG